MSTAESAECLEITEETAKTRLHRARKLLRDTLYERAGIESAAAFSFEAPRCDRVVAAVFEQIEAIDQSPYRQLFRNLRVEAVLLVDVADQFDGFHDASLWRFERSGRRD